MVKACLGILEFPFTKDHLKNRLKTLKSNFGEVKDLFNASGWGWDEDTSMFENEDEVWKESTQVRLILRILLCEIVTFKLL